MEDDGAAQLGGEVGGSRVGLEVREDSGGGGHGGRRRERGLVEQHLQQSLDVTIIMVCKITYSTSYSDHELKVYEQSKSTRSRHSLNKVLFTTILKFPFRF